MDSAPRAYQQSKARRLLFGVMLCVGFWVFSEMGAFVAFRYSDGEVFSFARITAEMHSRIGEESVASNLLNEVEQERWQPLEPQVVHPYLGYVFDPTHFLSVPDARRRKTVWGFADSASPFRKRAPDRVVVGILGGSLAREFAHVAPELLGQNFSASAKFAGIKLDVVRLAVNGYKQPQQLMTVSYLLALGAEFDLLLNIDGFNEVALHGSHNGPEGVFAAFPRAWRTRVQTLPDREALRAIGEISYLRAVQRNWARVFAGSPRRFSILADLIWKVRDTRLQADIARAREAVRTAKPARLRYVETGPPRKYASDEEIYADLVRLWGESSLQLDRLSRANNIQYFNFLQPNQYVADSKPMSEREAAVALSKTAPYRLGAMAGYPLLIQEGQRLVAAGVHFRDLTTIFRNVQEPVYRDNCCHLNKLGNEILAAEIAEFVLPRLKLSSPPRVSTASD